MNEINKSNNFFKNVQIFLSNNLRKIIIFVFILIISLGFFQIYIYFSAKQLKSASIDFFNSIQSGDLIIDNLEELSKSDNFFSTLSTLKIIQKNNEENNFGASNELYKKIIFSNQLSNLYKSSIAIHASYSLINASYIENTNNYLEDISSYINEINKNLESYFSIKKELEYLLAITDIDLKKSEYKNNSKVIEIYNSIINSDLISSSIKERVKKIHEFQIYK